nr:FlgD immunoglobulin-like domain containing protein [Candidatus Krumholzibacteria bacterium]
GSATTEDLQAAMESVSGRDLTAFFQQWIYGEYFPVYEFGWSQESGDGDLVVTINQVQDNAGVFTMPVPLRITTDQGTTDLKVENNQASQQFTITVNGTVESVRLDPDNWILRQVKTTVTNAPLDEGVLLVNGVDWGTYSAELDYSYEARAFWGNTPITFWDTFNAPAGGYPSSLPAPLGHGAVPADVIGNYSTVIWVGNNYAGDLAKWAETPISSYLEAGGNLLLMTRRSQDFLTDGLADYLDVNFAESGSTLGNCVAVAPDLVNIPFVGTQSWNDVFYNVVGPQSTVLFRDTSGFSSTRITGLVTVPEGGGTFRPDGGRFALISGRPYRMEASALMANVEEILATYLLEPYSPVVSGVEDEPALVPSVHAGLGSNYPNPFNPQTIIPFSLPQGGEIMVEVFDARGRLVSCLAQGQYPAGPHQLTWDGTDQAGRAVPSGVYFARLRDGQGVASTERMTLVR